ncbi:glycosyltransferase [Ornithinimicrobium sp. LYQ121]|uniref:glycosyltransferase n=1 Tax=Ornithinimicrobium sp. LYQ121 TaxID=3378801 RepID=UPI003851FBB5
MRVLLLSNLYPTASSPYAGVFVTQRIRALEARGHEVWPVGVRTVSRGALATVARRRGRSPKTAAPASPYGDYLLPVDLRRRLRRRLDASRVPATRALVDLVVRERIDLVHGHGMYLFPAGSIARDVARASGVPYVVTVHGQDVNTFMRGRVAAYREVLDGAGAVLCVSEDLASRVRGVMTVGAHAHVVPNGYDPDTFFVGVEEPPHGSNVLFVGNLEKVKGADRLPALLSRLRDLRPDVGLDVVGVGSLGPRLRTQLPDARFHGQVSPAEVASHMRRADVLVVPSRSEGWGTVITEAHACGLPAVGFDVGGVPEAIQLPQHVVPARAGVPGLARTVVRVLGEGGSRRELSLTARGRTWDDVAGEEERVYRAAVGVPATSTSDPDGQGP